MDLVESIYMTLTKDDLQAIGNVVDEKLTGTERRLLTEMDRRFIEQNKSRERHFTDLKVVMETHYVNREEFEERYNELQTEVEDLRKEVQHLKNKMATA